MKTFLHKEFTVNDLGQANYFLGIEMVYSEKGILISQQKYIMNILQKANLTEAKSSPTLFPNDANFRRMKEIYLKNLSNTKD